MKPKARGRGNSTSTGGRGDIAHQAAAWKTRADAGLDAQEAQALRAWLAADPRHQAAFARFDAVWERFDRPFHAAATDLLVAELKSRARRRRRRTVSAIASLAVLIALGSAWQWRARSNAGLAAHAAITDSLAGRAVLLLPARQTLPDGSTVELREDAEITLDFSPAARRILLDRGEAHFQVEKDAGRPFVVSAGGVEARAVGTSFSVEVHASAVEVLVTEGRVAVDQPVAASQAKVSAGGGPVPEPLPEPLAVLNMGHRIVVERDASPTAPPEIVRVDPEELIERLAWRAPRVEFTGASLAEAVALLNRHALAQRAGGRQGPQFVIEDRSLSSVRVSGLFRVDRTQAFISLLRNGFGIEAEYRPNNEVVLRSSR